MAKKKPAKPPAPQPDPKAKAGPQPEMLKIDVPWEDAVKTALQKKKPAGGWSKPEGT